MLSSSGDGLLNLPFRFVTIPLRFITVSFRLVTISCPFPHRHNQNGTGTLVQSNDHSMKTKRNIFIDAYCKSQMCPSWLAGLSCRPVSRPISPDFIKRILLLANRQWSSRSTPRCLPCAGVHAPGLPLAPCHRPLAALAF